MAIDFSIMIYSPCQAVFGRAIKVFPIKSQPVGSEPYYARGILDTRGTAIQTEAGMVVMSDQETILDIREIEFAVTPVQGDLVDIPAEDTIPAAGMYEITDAAWNGGGEVTLTLQAYKPPSETFVPYRPPPVEIELIKSAVGFAAAAGIASGQLTVLDNFNRANGVLGASWADLALSGYTGHPQIIANQVGMAVGAQHAISYWNAAFSNDQWCELSFPALAPYGALAVRCNPATNSALVVYISPSGTATDWSFYRWVNGNPASLGSGTLSSAFISSTDVVRLEIAGNILYLKLNGTIVTRLQDTVLTAGSPGIGCYDSAARMDNFRAGNLLSPPPPMPHGLYTNDSSEAVLPSGVLKLERNQPWSCLACFTILDRDFGNGSVLFTNVKDPPYTGYEIWIPPSGVVRVKIMHAFSTNEYLEVDGHTLVADGNAHMIGVSYDGSSTAAGVKIYVDGVPETMTTNMDNLSATIVTGASDLWIGNQAGNVWGMNGVTNFFAFSNLVRNAAYMAAHATLPTKPSVDANTTLYYDFSEGAGATLHDQSANGYNATINGNYFWS